MSSAPSSTFTPPTTFTGKRLAVGFGWGVFASIVMFAFMYIAMLVITTAFGKGLPDPLLIALMVASVLLSYGFGGAVLAGLIRPVKIWHGIGMGVFLWLIMGLVVLPFVGWGFFGLAITPMIALNALIFHLIYGITLGGVIDR
jgi:hypothetical protein